MLSDRHKASYKLAPFVLQVTDMKYVFLVLLKLVFLLIIAQKQGREFISPYNVCSSCERLGWLSCCFVAEALAVLEDAARSFWLNLYFKVL